MWINTKDKVVEFKWLGDVNSTKNLFSNGQKWIVRDSKIDIILFAKHYTNANIS